MGEPLKKITFLLPEECRGLGFQIRHWAPYSIRFQGLFGDPASVNVYPRENHPEHAFVPIFECINSDYYIQQGQESSANQQTAKIYTPPAGQQEMIRTKSNGQTIYKFRFAVDADNKDLEDKLEEEAEFFKAQVEKHKPDMIFIYPSVTGQMDDAVAIKKVKDALAEEDFVVGNNVKFYVADQHNYNGYYETVFIPEIKPQQSKHTEIWEHPDVKYRLRLFNGEQTIYDWAGCFDSIFDTENIGHLLSITLKDALKKAPEGTALDQLSLGIIVMITNEKDSYVVKETIKGKRTLKPLLQNLKQTEIKIIPSKEKFFIEMGPNEKCVREAQTLE